MGGMTLAPPGNWSLANPVSGRPFGLRTERDREMLVHEMLMVCGANGKVSSALIVFSSGNKIADVIFAPWFTPRQFRLRSFEWEVKGSVMRMP